MQSRQHLGEQEGGEGEVMYLGRSKPHRKKDTVTLRSEGRDWKRYLGPEVGKSKRVRKMDERKARSVLFAQKKRVHTSEREGTAERKR